MHIYLLPILFLHYFLFYIIIDRAKVKKEGGRKCMYVYVRIDEEGPVVLRLYAAVFSLTLATTTQAHAAGAVAKANTLVSWRMFM